VTKDYNRMSTRECLPSSGNANAHLETQSGIAGPRRVMVSRVRAIKVLAVSNWPSEVAAGGPGAWGRHWKVGQLNFSIENRVSFHDSLGLSRCTELRSCRNNRLSRPFPHVPASTSSKSRPGRAGIKPVPPRTSLTAGPGRPRHSRPAEDATTGRIGLEPRRSAAQRASSPYQGSRATAAERHPRRRRVD
jgi:hypothetical protein